MDEIKVSSPVYVRIKNRINNGKPFLKKMALERVNDALDNLEITVAEAKELKADIAAKGVDVLPDDAMGRLSIVEIQSNDNTKMIAEMLGGAM